jgi:hypothetical protein
MLWTAELWLGCMAWENATPPWAPNFKLGPTGDIVIGYQCVDYSISSAAVLMRLNGSEQLLYMRGNSYHGYLYGFAINPHNDLVYETSSSDISSFVQSLLLLDASGQLVTAWSASYPSIPSTGMNSSIESWASDALGNLFAVIWTDHADSSLKLPGPGTYLVRGGPSGDSFYSNFTGSFTPDQKGGVYLYGPLQSTLDLGCGPMVPASPQDSYLVHLDPSWACMHGEVLRAPVSLFPPVDGGVVFFPAVDGGVVLSTTSTTPLDLGCGVLPAVPSGSTLVTSLDQAGACVFGASFAAPNLKLSLSSAGWLVLGGVVDATPLDFGGGPLAPLGTSDYVIAELDPQGNYLWSKRFGAPGATFTGARVKLLSTGDVYLIPGFDGSIDFGGGAVTRPTGDLVVASFSAAGSHRWSRGFHMLGHYAADIDDCGGLVVASYDPAFDPGCGTGIPPCSDPLYCDPKVAVARFAP